VPSIVLSSFLAAQHRELDHVLEAADNACRTPQALSAVVRLQETMEHHLGIEERFLFPAFEERAGSGGPLVVMRDEHHAIRDLCQQARAALGAEDHKGCARILDTLTVLVQQHHLKEENVLYPMSDHLLLDRADDLVRAMSEEPRPHG